MKSSLKILSGLSLTIVTMTGCYTEPKVVREPAGAPITTRTTVSKTVTVDESPAPVRKTVIVDQPAVAETVIVDEPRVTTTIVDQPPAARVETAGVAPSAGQAWVPGHWTREADRWVWKSGQWEARPTPTAIYVPGHWENRADGYIWKEGYWK